MIEVVSFDILPTEVVELMEMTPTDYWSPEFEFLGYGNANWVEIMGSLGIFGVILLLQLLICPLLWLIEKRCNTERCMRRWKLGRVHDGLMPMTCVLGAQAFFQESYMELVISGMLGTKMLEVRPIWSF